MVATVEGEGKRQQSLVSLKRWNGWLALVYTLQGAAILVLGKRAEVPISMSYLTPDSVQSSVAGHAVLAPAVHQLWMVNVGYAVALFVFISAVAHFIAATSFRRRYEADLKRAANRLRWLDYTLSFGVMMVIIGLLSGVYDLSVLLGIFALTAVMNLLYLSMEMATQGKKMASRLAFWLHTSAGLVPWLIIGLCLLGANIWGGSHLSAFVYWIYGTTFVGFWCFAGNLWRQNRRKGKWADYLYGERVFMLLSLVVKTALAWQVFMGALRS